MQTQTQRYDGSGIIDGVAEAGREVNTVSDSLRQKKAVIKSLNRSSQLQ